MPRLLGERLCLDFVNTIEGPRSEHPEEFLLSYADLSRWGRHVDLLSAAEADQLHSASEQRPDRAAAVFERALGLRQALTRILRAVARGQAADDGDLQQLQALYLEALSHARIAPAPGVYAWRWHFGDGSLEHVLWAVARSAVELLTTGDLARVKECPGADDCGWLFYDTSKNGSRRWCSMEGCGSRVKMRQHYARTRS